MFCLLCHQFSTDLNVLTRRKCAIKGIVSGKISVASIIGSVIGNTLFRSILSISVLDLYTCQIASRSIWLLNGL